MEQSDGTTDRAGASLCTHVFQLHTHDHYHSHNQLSKVRLDGGGYGSIYGLRDGTRDHYHNRNQESMVHKHDEDCGSIFVYQGDKTGRHSMDQIASNRRRVGNRLGCVG